MSSGARCLVKSFLAFALVAFAAIASIGCSQSLDESIEELVTAKNKWIENCDTSNYIAQFEKINLAWGTGRTDISTKVKNGRVTEGFFDFKTIFNSRLESLQSQNITVKTKIKYHPKYGYPTFFSYDSSRIYDEEFELKTVEVTGCGA